MGMRALFGSCLGQISIFLKETNVIWFVPVNYMLSVIYSLILVKLLHPWPKKLLQMDKIGHISVRELCNNFSIFYFFFMKFSESMKNKISTLFYRNFKFWTNSNHFRKILSIFRGFLAIYAYMKQFNMNQFINHRQYVINWYKSNDVGFIQKYWYLAKKWPE